MMTVTILLEITVTLALALFVTRVARKSRAAVRHVVLAAAFGVVIVLPVASIVAPSVRVAVPAAVTQAMAPLSTLDDVPDLPASTAVDVATVVEPTSPRVAWPSIPSLLMAVWITGTSVCLLGVMLGLRQVRALRASGLPWRAGGALTDGLALEAGIRRPIDVLLHESLPGPMTCGIVRPAIMLPADAATWAPEDLRRAIVHELEHVRRADWLSQCSARVVSACYWFHPIVWMASRQLALEAERACDDAVLSASSGWGTLDDPVAYADQLVALAQRLSTARHVSGLAMASRADLSRRVSAVLDSRQRRGRAGASWVTVGTVVAATLVLAMSPVRIVGSSAVDPHGSTSPAQSAVESAAARFDLVSIKRCDDEVSPPPTGPGARGRGQGGFPTTSPGRFTIECGTIERLISNAYVLHGEPLVNQVARIGDVEWWKGGPDWIRYEKYTIEAKADGTPDKEAMLGPMLRAVLEDRFKLKLRRETDEMPIYAMTVAKAGLKIKPIGPDGCAKMDPDSLGPGGNYHASLAAGGTPQCGVMSMLGRPGRNSWVIGGTTMPDLARTLSAQMDHYVVDRTGADGRFNVRLEFAHDEHTSGADKRNGPPTEVTEPEPGVSYIFKALEDQLGLKLDLTKGPHGFLVIDHIERPSSDRLIQQTGSGPVAPQKFDVASVKPCPSVTPIPGGRSGGGGSMTASPGLIDVTCMTVVEMAARAYVQYGTPPPVNSASPSDADVITGGPDWARSDRYTIEAKADGSPANTVMMGAMLRGLLADRFQLKVHEDVKEVPGFALTVAAGGLKLTPVDPGSCTPPDPNRMGGPRTMGSDGFVRMAPGDKPLCTGGVGQHGSNLTYKVNGQTFDRVARTLSSLVLGHPVVDKTGATGQFSFDIEFAPDETMRQGLIPPGTATSDPASGPTLYSVFEKQLGLKLVAAKAPQGHLVIDHVERPSPNGPATRDVAGPARSQGAGR